MTGLHLAALAALVLAAIAGVAVARRREAHRPAAVALVLLALATVLRPALVFGVIRPARAMLADPAAPLSTPLALAAIYLDGAAELATYAIVAGLAVATCTARPRRAAAIVGGVWLLASVVLGALYPSPVVRGASLQRIYFAADLIGLFVAVTAFLWWARLRRSPTSAHVILLLLAFGDAAVLLAPSGPWRAPIFDVSFSPVQLMILVLFSFLALFQGVLWISRPR